MNVDKIASLALPFDRCKFDKPSHVSRCSDGVGRRMFRYEASNVYYFIGMMPSCSGFSYVGEEYEVTLMVGRARQGRGEERRGSTYDPRQLQPVLDSRTDRQPDALRRGTRAVGQSAQRR
jgi:hypothetical protein